MFMDREITLLCALRYAYERDAYVSESIANEIYYHAHRLEGLHRFRFVRQIVADLSDAQQGTVWYQLREDVEDLL